MGIEIKKKKKYACSIFTLLRFLQDTSFFLLNNKSNFLTLQKISLIDIHINHNKFLPFLQIFSLLHFHNLQSLMRIFKKSANFSSFFKKEIIVIHKSVAIDFVISFMFPISTNI